MTDGEPDDPGENTPPDTSSALLKLGLAICPCCEGTGTLVRLLSSGLTMDHLCEFCGGGKRVSIDKKKEWKGHQE
jgi:hypothetical protein